MAEQVNPVPLEWCTDLRPLRQHIKPGQSLEIGKVVDTIPLVYTVADVPDILQGDETATLNIHVGRRTSMRRAAKVIESFPRVLRGVQSMANDIALEPTRDKNYVQRRQMELAMRLAEHPEEYMLTALDSEEYKRKLSEMKDGVKAQLPLERMLGKREERTEGQEYMARFSGQGFIRVEMEGAFLSNFSQEQEHSVESMNENTPAEQVLYIDDLFPKSWRDNTKIEYEITVKAKPVNREPEIVKQDIAELSEERTIAALESLTPAAQPKGYEELSQELRQLTDAFADLREEVDRRIAEVEQQEQASNQSPDLM